MTLYPAIGPNRYCGPGALAILTGLDTGQAAKHLRALSGKRAICGIHWEFVTEALKQRGYNVEWFDRLTHLPGHQRPTLAQWVALRLANRNYEATYLVTITGHYLVVRWDGNRAEVCDNLTIYPIPLERYRQRRRRRVTRAWVVDRPMYGSLATTDLT